MAKNIQAVRGMKDILPDQTPLWQFLEQRVRAVLNSYAYQEIRMPTVESTDLFKRSIGEVTDIVEKEMYTFDDRNGDSLTLRPEGTAGCVRAAIENGLLHNQIQRLWYQGAMFRHERPQKGRYRQFHQIGVETFGLAGPDIDLEVLLITTRIWKSIGLHGLELQINTLGTAEERKAYRDKLVAYLNQYQDQLDEDSQRRLGSNPLRILDSKNPQMQEIISNAPALIDELGEESRQHFDWVCSGLKANDISFVINPRLVRGLDYYSRTVFEWVTDRLGAQGTVCAGGRYDALVSQLGGRETPAVGFAMGMERLVAILEEEGRAEGLGHADVYMVLMGDKAVTEGFQIAEKLRSEIPQLGLQVNCGGGSFKSQFKKADKSGARYALVLGDDELEKGIISLKPLRDKQDQKELPLQSLSDNIRPLLKSEE
ncbi:MAG: histidine--tRNA ligase [Gammaproteobacteria bacterium]|nr:histidine--tRNA ligase [Gammaproteobacteria bacterium]NNJ92620.1 histidine--tRNA ligase [Gammaproteobacteria bacterium]